MENPYVKGKRIVNHSKMNSGGKIFPGLGHINMNINLTAALKRHINFRHNVYTGSVNTTISSVHTMNSVYSLVALTAGPFSVGYLWCGELLIRSGSETGNFN
jgi:hypothetical protein